MLYFIVNQRSRSGKGAKIWREAEQVLQQRHMSYRAWTTEYEGHAGKLAQKICKRKDAQISLVAVGGDGTANEVINGITDFARVRFGMIPTGSGNDLARGLGIQGSPAECLERILACLEDGDNACVTIDLGQVSWEGGAKRRLFAISSGVGLGRTCLQNGVKVKDQRFFK